MDQVILVTGANGFVGRNVVHHLGSRPGVRIVATDIHENLIPLHGYPSGAITYLNGDLSSREFVTGLQDRSRSGRPRVVSSRKTAQVVAFTLKRPEPGVTHWTSRDLARHVGLSHTTVHRIWRAHSLQPHRVQTFKFTKDP